MLDLLNDASTLALNPNHPYYHMNPSSLSVSSSDANRLSSSPATDNSLPANLLSPQTVLQVLYKLFNNIASYGERAGGAALEEKGRRPRQPVGPNSPSRSSTAHNQDNPNDSDSRVLDMISGHVSNHRGHQHAHHSPEEEEKRKADDQDPSHCYHVNLLNSSSNINPNNPPRYNEKLQNILALSSLLVKENHLTRSLFTLYIYIYMSVCLLRLMSSLYSLVS